MFYYLFLVYGRDGVAKSLFVKKQVVLTKRGSTMVSTKDCGNPF